MELLVPLGLQRNTNRLCAPIEPINFPPFSVIQQEGVNLLEKASALEIMKLERLRALSRNKSVPCLSSTKVVVPTLAN
jgi:hypothetical protein